MIKDAESADMVGRANVGYFLLRSPTASMAMTASCEAYAQVKWSLVTIEDATLEVWVRLFGYIQASKFCLRWATVTAGSRLP